MVDDLRNAVGADDSIVDYLRAPSVTVLYAVTKDGISCYMLAHKDAITDNERIVGVGSRTSRTGSTSDDGRVKAFAARKGKEYCSHTQCQDESQ
jgi:hypothetical protein